MLCYIKFIINKCGWIYRDEKDKDFISLNGVPVIEFSEIALDNETGIVIAVNEKNKEEIVKTISIKYPDFSNMFYFVY